MKRSKGCSFKDLAATRSCLIANQFRDAAGLVPVGNINVGLQIDEAAVCGAEKYRGYVTGLELIIGPLRFLRIVAEEGYGSVIAVEDGDAAFAVLK